MGIFPGARDSGCSGAAFEETTEFVNTELGVQRSLMERSWAMSSGSPSSDPNELVKAAVLSSWSRPCILSFLKAAFWRSEPPQLRAPAEKSEDLLASLAVILGDRSVPSTFGPRGEIWAAMPR